MLRKFQRDGVWEAVWAELGVPRADPPRGQPLGGGSLQSVDRQVGYHAGKQVRAARSMPWSTANGR
jgi:hypothetical protein